MKDFEFCGSCGVKLPAPNHEGERTCEQCGSSWYPSASPTAGAAIVKEGRVLVTVRGSDPYKGRIDGPGGFLMPDEHPIEGLKRELREELGLEIDVSVDDCLSMAPHRYGDDGGYVLALGFKARLVSGEPKADSDVADFRWVSHDELDDLDWAWEHDKELVRKALDHG